MKKKYPLSFITIFLLFFHVVNAQNHQQNNRYEHQQKSVVHLNQTQAANTRSDTVDILKYTINLNITDFTTNTIRGNTEVKYTPKVNGVNIIDLDLLVMSVDSVKQGLTTLSYNYDDTLLRVHLPAIINVSDTSIVTVYYHGTPQMDHPSGWGGFYFQNGYAFNLGVGFDANPHVYGRVWFPCFDNFVERSTYEFNIITNNGKTSYCNGYLAKDTTDGSGNRTRKWIMNEQIPTYLASVAVAGYAQINQTYNGINGSIPIIIAALPGDTAHVKTSFVNLNNALSTFENRFGPYRWNRVGYCLVPFSGGAMEHATNIAYPIDLTDGTLSYQDVLVHELSHHWFGDLVTCRTAEDMWLNEGWARYCEFIFHEALNGYANYLSVVRTNHAENLQFLHEKEGGYLTLSNIPLAYTYGDHVYNKGADVAHTLRSYMGDSLFFYSVKNYLTQNQYKDVSSADFRDALSASSGLNMTDFFNDWVFNPGWTHFSIDSFNVVSSGSNYNVTVSVKQKLTAAPHYYNNVPLEVTFKASDWTEQTQHFIMSGAHASFNFTVPFSPVFVAVNMGEKISHAVAPEIKKIKTTGSFNFANAKMNITVQSISDSAFIRVEHNYVAPDSFKTYGHPYRLSPNHYWKVDGILPSNFKAKASLTYEGRTLSFGGNYYLDNNLLTTYEDSLVLMYRKSAAEEWNVYPFYTKNMIGNHNDKHGIVTIDTLKLGEYVFAMKDPSVGISSQPLAITIPEIKVFPNPANDLLTVDLTASMLKLPNNSLLVITDSSGKIVYKEKLNQHTDKVNINTAQFSSGMYLISIKGKDAVVAKNNFIVVH